MPGDGGFVVFLYLCTWACFVFACAHVYVMYNIYNMEKIWRILKNPEEALEYVERVCNHFWPARDKSAPAEESLGGQEIHNAEPDRRQSLVPLFFKKALERGTLLRRMQFYDEYLEAYNNHAYSNKEKLQDILRRFGLDSRKFWFLCLAARWQAVLYAERSKIKRPTVLEVLNNVTDAIEQIDHSKYWYSCMTPHVAKLVMNDAARNMDQTYQNPDQAHKILSLAEQVLQGKDTEPFDEAELTLKIKKDGKTVRTVTVSDDASLSAISRALKEYVQKNGKSPHMNALIRPSHTEGGDAMCTTLAYFTLVLKWFLGEYKKEHNIKTRLYNQKELIAHMAHILKMDGPRKEPYNARELDNAIGRYLKEVDPYDFTLQ